jgi:hypothetical protein
MIVRESIDGNNNPVLHWVDLSLVRYIRLEIAGGVLCAMAFPEMGIVVCDTERMVAIRDELHRRGRMLWMGEIGNEI